MFGKLIDQVKVLFKPDRYWDSLSAEPGSLMSLLMPRILILAAIPAATGLLFGLFRFSGMGALGLGAAIGTSIFAFIVQSGIWFVLSFLIDAFASPFGGYKDPAQARKLAYGALFPMWIAGVGNILGGLGALLGLAGFGYGCYLLYLGLPKLNGTPQNKAAGYVAAVMAITIVIVFFFSFLSMCMQGACIAGAVLNAGAAAG